MLVLVLVLVLEWNVWFWCVRGQLDPHRSLACMAETAMQQEDRLTHPTG